MFAHAAVDFDHFCSTIGSLGECEYEVFTFRTSHNQLLIKISAVPIYGKLFLILSGVSYTRMPMFWRNIALKADLGNLSNDIVSVYNRNLVELYNDSLLLYSNQPDCEIQILCSEAYITNEPPPDYHPLYSPGLLY